MTSKVKIKMAAWVVVIFFVFKACAPDRATWYGTHLRGKKMANGQPFDPNGLTAASWEYPLGTKLKLSHDDKSVVVVVTDRGGDPAFLQFGKTIDLTRAAFARLEDPKEGSVHVKIRQVK